MFQFDLILDQLLHLDFTPFVLAIFVGGMIGLEREVHGRPAGLRTHIMVCLSAALLVQASRWVGPGLEGSAGRLVVDPNRLASGIVTGIGFLGAAAVIRSGDIVRGITTGACVWAVAGLGVVIGQGHYGLAIAGGLVMLLVLVAFDSLLAWVEPVVYRQLTVHGSGADPSEVSAQVRQLLEARNIRVQDLTGCARRDGYELVFHVRCRQRLGAAEVLSLLQEEAQVQQVEWSQISG